VSLIIFDFDITFTDFNKNCILQYDVSESMTSVNVIIIIIIILLPKIIMAAFVTECVIKEF